MRVTILLLKQEGIRSCQKLQRRCLESSIKGDVIVFVCSFFLFYIYIHIFVLFFVNKAKNREKVTIPILSSQLNFCI